MDNGCRRLISFAASVMAKLRFKFRGKNPVLHYNAKYTHICMILMKVFTRNRRDDFAAVIFSLVIDNLKAHLVIHQWPKGNKCDSVIAMVST